MSYFCGRIVVLTLLILCLYNSRVSAVRTVKIAILYSGSGVLQDYGQTYPVVGSMWSNWISQQSHGLGGLDIYPELYLYDVRSLPSQTAVAIQDLLANNISVVSGPEAGLIEMVTVSCLNAQPPIPVVSTMDSSSDLFASRSRAYPNMFGTLTPMTQYFTNLYPLIRKRYNRVTFIHMDDALNTEVCTGSLTDAMVQGLNIVSLHVINSSGDHVSAIAETLSQVSQIDRPDVLFFCGYAVCDDFLLGLKYSGWTPSVIVTFECGALAKSVVSGGDPDLIDAYRYIVTPQQWDPRLVGRKYIDNPINLTSDMFPMSNGNISSAESFNTSFQVVANGLSINSVTASQMAGLYAIATAVIVCNCTISTGIMEAMQKITLSSFYGLINFDLNGENSFKEMVYVQLDSALESNLLYPSANLTIDPIWPIPTHQERVYSNKILSQSSEIAVLVLGVTGALLALLLSIFLLVYRKHPEVRATSPWFTCVFLGGCMIGCLWTPSWLLNNTQLMCSLRNPGMSLALGMMLSSILAKTSRIARIFDMRKLRTRKITDLHVAKVMSLILVPLLLFTFIGEIARPTISTRYTVDPVRPVFDYTDCVYQLPALVFPFLAWVVVNLVLCVYYAYRVTAAYAEFNEARGIVRVVGLLTLFSVVNAFLAALTTTTNRETIFLCRSLCNLGVFGGAALVLSLGRVSAVWSSNIVHPKCSLLQGPQGTVISPSSRKIEACQSPQRSPMPIDLQRLKPPGSKSSSLSPDRRPSQNPHLQMPISPKSQTQQIKFIRKKPKSTTPFRQPPVEDLLDDGIIGHQAPSPHQLTSTALDHTGSIKPIDPRSQNLIAVPPVPLTSPAIDLSPGIPLTSGEAPSPIANQSGQQTEDSHSSQSQGTQGETATPGSQSTES